MGVWDVQWVGHAELGYGARDEGWGAQRQRAIRVADAPSKPETDRLPFPHAHPPTRLHFPSMHLQPTNQTSSTNTHPHTHTHTDVRPGR